jgi:hypothetical protein
MRFMMMMKSNEDAESGALPPAEGADAMRRYNDEMVKAGILLAAEGLYPSAQGAKVVFTDGTPSVTDGPFTEAKELIAGYWMIQVKDRDEALAWARRCPRPPEGRLELELRQIFETADFEREMRAAGS